MLNKRSFTHSCWYNLLIWSCIDGQKKHIKDFSNCLIRLDKAAKYYEQHIVSYIYIKLPTSIRMLHSNWKRSDWWKALNVELKKAQSRLDGRNGDGERHIFKKKNIKWRISEKAAISTSEWVKKWMNCFVVFQYSIVCVDANTILCLNQIEMIKRIIYWRISNRKTNSKRSGSCIFMVWLFLFAIHRHLYLQNVYTHL